MMEMEFANAVETKEAECMEGEADKELDGDFASGNLAQSDSKSGGMLFSAER